VLASLSIPAFAQEWPIPGTAPRTEVICNTNQCGEHEGKKIVGYDAPITKFVGRYLDSTGVGVDFNIFQTARTKLVRFAPDRNRIYMLIGSALVAYDMDTFFSRLEAKEQLMNVKALPMVLGRYRWAGGRNEMFLPPDRFFYPKFGSPEQEFPDLNAGDGEDKMFDYDWDDRGYVYMACGPYSWGITKDDGGKFPTESQRLNTIFQLQKEDVDHSSDEEEPNTLVVTKVGSKYYLVVSNNSGGKRTTVWDVTNPATPVRHRAGSLGASTGAGIDQHARNASGSHTAIVTRGTGKLEIYTSEALANLSAPSARFETERYISVISDGTNFYAVSTDQSTSAVVISIFSPSGNSWDETRHKMGAKFSAGAGPVSYGGGHLVVMTRERERGINGQPNLWLYKLNGLSKPIETNLGSWTGAANTDYVARYYTSAASPSHVSPGAWSLLRGGHIWKKGSKYYLIVEAFGLGDVYEIKGSDAIAAAIKKRGTTPNEYSKQTSNGPFYGDNVTFTSTFTGSVAPSVTWDFGDGAIETTPPGSPDISHQYGGLIASDLPKKRNVKATNPGDSTMSDSLEVTLEKPAARVGLLNSTTVFTAATTNYSLPIVSSDEFVDASDGAVEGHYSDWKIDTAASVLSKPNTKQSVGGLGKHTLVFKAHYGPYTVSGNNITPGSSEALFSIDSIKYEVRPFAAAMAGPLSCAGLSCTTTINNLADGVGFRSATRVTTAGADLTGTSNAMVHYKWELLKPGTGGLIPSGIPLKEGDSKISEVPDFVVPRTAFTGAVDWKARLTLALLTPTAVSDPLYAVSTIDSVPLLGPTPGDINQTGCANAGAACSFNVPSTRQDVDPAGWQYLWTTTGGPSGVASGASPVYQPKFTAAGTYVVKVTVKNALGDATLEKQVVVGAPVCASSPSNTNMVISYKGATTGCASGAVCNAGEVIGFSVQPFGWTKADCDVYDWDFGDNTTHSTAAEPTHSYSNNGTYTVKVTVKGGSGEGTVSRQITVGNTDPGPGPGPGPSPGCGTMTRSNVFFTASGNASGCTLTNGQACRTTDTMTFEAKSFGYSYTCATHSYSWTFGDGSGATGSFAQHKYTSPGSYSVNLRISNGPQTIDIPATLVVQGETGTTCPTMVAGANVFAAYTGPTSGCNANAGECKPAELIAFRASSVGYSYDCSPHTYAWDFGDNTTSTLKDPTKAFASGGTYTVKLKITRQDGATVTDTRTVKVGSGLACPKMIPQLNVFTTFVGSESHCTSSSSDGCQEGEEITFNVSSFQYNFECSPHDFLWDFGDGSPAGSGKSPAHTYTRPGTFTVKVKVTNSGEEIILEDIVKVNSDGPTRRRPARK
jgi:PKD repeat protein